MLAEEVVIDALTLTTPSEADALDHQRGDVPRSEYIRRRLFDSVAKAG